MRNPGRSFKSLDSGPVLMGWIFREVNIVIIIIIIIIIIIVVVVVVVVVVIFIINLQVLAYKYAFLCYKFILPMGR